MAYSQEELVTIRDLLNLETIMVRRLAGYQEQVKNASLKQTCDDLKRVHQQHYNLLLRHLAEERIPLQ